MPPKRRAASPVVTARAKRARVEKLSDEPDIAIPVAPKKRGRPPKVANRSNASDQTPTNNTRSPKSTRKNEVSIASQSLTPKKRGRPSKLGQDSPSEPPKKIADKTPVTGSEKRGRGRPPKIATNAESTKRRGPGRPSNKSLRKTDTVTDASDDESDNERDGVQYWLMKAEPNDRFENGHNVKFSIDDLANASEPEPWDGVRNYQARNKMRAMRAGDLGFFYHSNCQIPGIVGVLRIVKEHTVDESAFDPQHPYYDAKSSRDKPKWDVVHVEFVKKFDKIISLKMLNANAASSGELSKMQVLTTKRLSVTSVRPQEWKHILKIAGENMDVGEQGPKEQINGSESTHEDESENVEEPIN